MLADIDNESVQSYSAEEEQKGQNLDESFKTVKTVQTKLNFHQK